MKRAKLFKLSYCLTVLSIALPIGLAGSGWVRMSVGGALGLIPFVGPLLMLMAGVGRVVQIWRRPWILDSPVVAGGARQFQAIGVGLIYAGAVAGIANWLSIPVAKMFIKDAGPNGILLYAGGVYLALLGGLGPLGLFVFEVTRLLGFEKALSPTVPPVSPTAPERPTFSTMGLDNSKLK